MLYVKSSLAIIIRQAKPVNGLQRKSLSTILSKRTCLHEVKKSQRIDFVYEWTGRRYMSREANELPKNSDSVKSHDDQKQVDDIELGNISLKEDNLELFKKIANGDENKFQKLRNIQVAINVAECQYNVTLNLTEKEWVLLLSSTVSERITYTSNFLSKALKERRQRKRNAKTATQSVEQNNNSTKYDPMCYHSYDNSLFLEFKKQSLRDIRIARIMKTLLSGPELLIDCSYEEYMSDGGMKYLAKMISDGININIGSEKPFHIVLCNFDRNGVLAKYITQYLHEFFEPNFPITITDKSYLDLYPVKSLVYLTPYCDVELRAFDPAKRYIIGAFEETGNYETISLGKAKMNKVQMQMIPANKYLALKRKKNFMSTFHCIKFMLGMRQHNSVVAALTAIRKKELAAYLAYSPKSMQDTKMIATLNKLYSFNDRKS